MPRTWTEAQKKELAERVRARHAARRAGAAPVVDTTEEVLNPIANDVVEPSTKLVHRRVRSAVPAIPVATHFSAQSLIEHLESIPLETVSYPDCGLLLNALSKASTAVALARRQRQEQLEAGTQRAICKTCGRPIDISKSGGFQILTERDEHHMPCNSYYCSQNCLLARNMPSHARQTPRQKQANQA